MQEIDGPPQLFELAQPVARVMGILSDLDGVRKVHPAFKDFDPKDAVKLANVPLHPGAEKAYKEAGLLK